MPLDPPVPSGPKVPRAANRGPAAAAENRAAILTAARRLFASEGYLVPLSAIAREAGVGQGVLYRHFRRRLDLTYAVFEENLVALEEIAGRPGTGVFEDLWRELLERTVTAAAFVEMMLEMRRTAADYGGAERLAALITGTLARAQAGGEVAPSLTPADVVLAWRMAFGVVATAETAEQARADLSAARLLGIELDERSSSGRHEVSRRP